MAQARADRADTKRELRLGAKQGLVVKDVVQDADGVQHVRYNRTFDGLPVIGGDLVVHEGADRALSQVEWATDRKIAVASTKADVSAQKAADSSARRTGLKDGTASPRKVVYAVRHAPVLAWETTVTGTTKAGTPSRTSSTRTRGPASCSAASRWSSTPTAPATPSRAAR